MSTPTCPSVLVFMDGIKYLHSCAVVNTWGDLTLGIWNWLEIEMPSISSYNHSTTAVYNSVLDSLDSCNGAQSLC